ncbi:MAG: hypothetical protein EA402_14845 [Planctomycetota bacterium]|nr:MAG: hypothetical protein EA402_14845 [Planctomycetota bacterium]
MPRLWMAEGTTKREAELGAVIGEGGEGTISTLKHYPHLVVKCLHRPAVFDSASKQRAQRWRAKVRALCAHAATLSDSLGDVCGIPRALVVDSRGCARGFTMPLLKGVPVQRYTNLEARWLADPTATWADCVAIARDIAALVARIHAAGFVIGDLNESAFVVNADDHYRVSAVDCDSWQFTHLGRHHRCEVAKREYLAPECIDASLSTLLRTPAHDHFSLAVLITQLLIQRHPFSLGSINILDNIRNGVSICDREPLPGQLPLTILPAALRRAVSKGIGLHPRQRPTADEWALLLNDLHQRLTTCQRVPEHRYLPGTGTCPWCQALNEHHMAWFIGGRSHLRGNLLKTPLKGYQRAIDRLMHLRNYLSSAELPHHLRALHQAVEPALAAAHRWSLTMDAERHRWQQAVAEHQRPLHAAQEKRRKAEEVLHDWWPELTTAQAQERWQAALAQFQQRLQQATTQRFRRWMAVGAVFVCGMVVSPLCFVLLIPIILAWRHWPTLDKRPFIYAAARITERHIEQLSVLKQSLPEMGPEPVWAPPPCPLDDETIGCLREIGQQLASAEQALERQLATLADRDREWRERTQAANNAIKPFLSLSLRSAPPNKQRTLLRALWYHEQRIETHLEPMRGQKPPVVALRDGQRHLAWLQDRRAQVDALLAHIDSCPTTAADVSQPQVA